MKIEKNNFVAHFVNDPECEGNCPMEPYDAMFNIGLFSVWCIHCFEARKGKLQIEDRKEIEAKEKELKINYYEEKLRGLEGE